MWAREDLCGFWKSSKSLYFLQLYHSFYGTYPAVNRPIMRVPPIEAWQMGITSCNSASKTLYPAIDQSAHSHSRPTDEEIPVEVLRSSDSNNRIRVRQSCKYTDPNKKKKVWACEDFLFVHNADETYSLEFSNWARTAILSKLCISVPVVEESISTDSRDERISKADNNLLCAFLFLRSVTNGRR